MQHERSVHDQIQDILNKLARAHQRGTGCRLTAHEMHILSVTMIGQWWGQPDERKQTAEKGQNNG
jgi:hypothetical protein